MTSRCQGSHRHHFATSYCHERLHLNRHHCLQTTRTKCCANLARRSLHNRGVLRRRGLPSCTQNTASNPNRQKEHKRKLEDAEDVAHALSRRHHVLVPLLVRAQLLAIIFVAGAFCSNLARPRCNTCKHERHNWGGGQADGVGK